HDKPDMERIQILNEILGKFDYRIKGANNEVHPKEFQKIIEDSKDKGLSLLIHKTILMSLKQARYTKENTGHFGLSSTYYTHFTSPIRRYADLMIHRICALTLGGYPNEKSLGWLNKVLDGICAHISKTERDSMHIEEESKKIKIIDFMKNKIGNEYDAIVVGFNFKKVFFETTENIECFWDVVASKDDYFEYNEREFTMTGQKTGKIYALGDKCKITIASVNKTALEIEVVPKKEEENS
ncbi:MAG: RNB domain-containing ribonuclease, partial [Fusobacteriaceae bacterium]